MHKEQQLLTHPQTGSLVDVSGIFDLFDALSNGGSNSLTKDIKMVKERLTETSRRIFNLYDTDAEISEFKQDINFFLLFGDFVKSVQIFSEDK